MNRDQAAKDIEAEFANGWEGTADEWWAQHPLVSTINNVAPVFTHLSQAGLIEPTGEKRRTRHGGMARVFRKVV